MKKILVSLMIIALVVGITGAGLAAYFEDTETSTGNTFNAGTLNLELSGSGGNNIWVSLDNWAPGETVLSTITFVNAGTVDIGWIGIKPVNVSAAPVEFPTRIIITEFSMQEVGGGDLSIGNIADFMATWGIWGTTAPLTLAEFASGDYRFWTEPTDWLLLANYANTVSLTMEFQFDPEAGNYYQSATGGFELEVMALQNGSGGPAGFTHVGDAACGYGQ